MSIINRGILLRVFMFFTIMKKDMTKIPSLQEGGEGQTVCFYTLPSSSDGFGVSTSMVPTVTSLGNMV